MKKYELHAHTSECDLYSQVSGKEHVRRLYEKGYSGMVITDHYFCHFNDWFFEELCGKTKEEIIKRRLKGYYAAREEGEKIGFTVLPGAEVRFDGQINDYLIYGADEEFFYKAPYLNELSGLEELKSILPDDIVIVQAHPFRNKMTVCDPSHLFGIEVYNGVTEDYRNEMALGFASHYGKAFTSGSDTHGHDAVGRGGIATERDIKTPKQLAEVLKSGQYSLIKKGEIV